MASNLIRVSVRFSQKTLASLASVEADAGFADTQTKLQDTVQFLLDRFLQNPIYIDCTEAIDLRLPLLNPTNLNLSAASVNALSAFAKAHQITLSAALRLAMYVGSGKNEKFQ